MRVNIQYVVRGLVIIGLLSIFGCQPPQVEEPQPAFTLQQTQEVIALAREHVETIATLPTREQFPEDFQEAQHELTNAEQLLGQHALDAAHQSAQKSLEASQRILREVYRQIISQSAQKAKADIQTITEDDPDNPLQDFIPELNSILDYSDEIQDEELLVELRKVMKDLDMVKQIEHNTKKNVSRTLEMDMSFAPGQHDLSNEGKQFLQEYSHEILVSKHTFHELYPDQPVIITIKVIGYADPVRFKEGTKLLELLVEGFEGDIPERLPDRRKFFNQRLSEFRAKAIGDYTTELLTRHETEQSQLQIKQEVIGLGEEFPPGVKPPYPMQDPRRRICKIYSYITTP